jgi:FkbM family methyltransferase
MIKFIKKSLFKILGLNTYLSLTQKAYLLAYTYGYLKRNESYDWHYFAKKLIKPDDIIIDIGANLGYFTKVFLDTINKDGHLYSVEPVEAYRVQLKKIIKKNKAVTIIPFALGDKNEPSITLGMPAAFKDLGYLRHGVVTLQTDERLIASDYQFKSELKKGSEVFKDLQKLDYIKCDIEGHEVVVLKEMEELLVKHKPLVQLETWGEQLPMMLSFFSSIGFDAYHLSNGKLINASSLSTEEISTSDVLFAHHKKFERIKPYL